MSEPSIDLHPAIAQLVEELSRLPYVKIFGSLVLGPEVSIIPVQMSIWPLNVPWPVPLTGKPF